MLSTEVGTFPLSNIPQYTAPGFDKYPAIVAVLSEVVDTIIVLLNLGKRSVLA